MVCYKKGTTQSYGEAIKQGYFKTKLVNEWKRMNAMDVSDVYYEKFLINGKNKSQLSQFKASELKFIPFEYEGGKKIDMIVYLKNYTICSHNKNLSTLINIMLQGLLGEKSMLEKYQFCAISTNAGTRRYELIYLYDLQLYLDCINVNKET